MKPHDGLGRSAHHYTSALPVTKIQFCFSWQAPFVPSLLVTTSSTPSCKKSKEYLTLCQTFCSGHIKEEANGFSHSQTRDLIGWKKTKKNPQTTKQNRNHMTKAILALVSMVYGIKGNVIYGWKSLQIHAPKLPDTPKHLSLGSNWRSSHACS